MLTRSQVRRTPRAVFEPLEGRRLMAAGDFDPSFGGGDGRASVTFPGTAFEILDTVVQDDGKIVLAGKKGSNAAVARLNVDGSLDTSFASGGLFEYGGINVDLAEARGVAVAADGKIVVGGFSRTGQGQSRFTVGRLTGNGARDPSFGGGLGIVRSEVDFNIPREASTAEDLAIQTDGKIVAVGRSMQDRFNTFDFDMVVVRYNTDGTHDRGFADGDGTAVIEISGTNETAFAVAIDYTDNPLTNPRYGSIVTAGQAAAEGSPPGQFALARLNPDGTADNSFSGDGRLISPSLSPRPFEFARGVVVQPGGKIVAAGTSQSSSDPADNDFLMARYNVNGTLDTTFGSSGTGAVELDLGGNDRAESLATGFQGGLVLSGVSDGNFALAAFDADGDADDRFGGDGVLTTTIPGAAFGLFATGSAFTTTRRLVVAGGNQVARLVDVGSIVSVSSVDPNGSEAGREPAHFFVSRTKRLPFSERVILNVGGTARAPFQLFADYEGSSNITFGNTLLEPTFVDIPANQTIVEVTITPFDDTRVEGVETAVFAVAPNAAYDIGTPGSTTLEIVDNEPPPAARVTQVFVNGPGLTGGSPSADQEAFRAQAGIDPAFGYAVPAGPDQTRSVPWIGGVDSFSIRFDANMTGRIEAGDLRIPGVDQTQFTPTAFSYDAGTRTATWRLPSPVVNAKLRLFLDDGDVPALDGEWQNASAAESFPSGDGTAGGDFDFRMNILTGDATGDGRVNALDLAFGKQRLNRTATNPGTGAGAYSVFADATGDGRINALDLAATKQRLGRNLPGGDPATAMLR